MQFSQAYSQPAKQPCSSGEFGGETKPNAAISQAPLPGFSAEQTSSIYQLFQAIFDQRVGPLQQPVQQPNPTQSTSSAKKKRNQKTRNQKKAKAQAQAQQVTVQVQEVDHIQEMEHSVQISVGNVASKHVVLHHQAPWDWMATSSHAVISWIGMAFFDELIMVQNGAIWRPRMGVG